MSPIAYSLSSVPCTLSSILCPLSSVPCCRSGKCIGAKNLKAFYLFTGMLCLQIYYLMGCFLYYIIYLADVGAPTGPNF
jgi:hypothetical protein